MKPSKLMSMVLSAGAALALVTSNLTAENKSQDPGSEKNSSFVILPIVFYSPETRWGGGTGGIFTFRPAWSRDDGRPSFIPFKAIYSQNKQTEIGIEPEFYIKGGDLVLQGNLSFRKFPEKFYGIGNHIPDGQEEGYTPQHIALSVSLQKRIVPGRNVFAGLAYEYDQFKILALDPGGELGSGTIPGSKGGAISGFSTLLRLDSRDNVFFPKRGFDVLLWAEWNSRIFGSDYGFVKATADARAYLPVFQSHVLAFQGVFQAGSGDIPFMALPKLGGEKILRGIPSGRYRDKVMTVFQAEYRMPVFWRIGLVGFVGVGSVGDRISSLKYAKWRFSGGWGIRFKLSPSEGINLRLDFGYGKGSSGVYITAAEAF